MTFLAWHPAAVLTATVLTAAEADPVQSGRKALGHWFQYPWYDQATDGLKRIDVQPPPPTPGPSSPWFNLPDLSWLLWTVVAIMIGLALLLLWRWWRQWQMRPKAGLATAGVPAARPAPEIEALPFDVPRPRGDLLEEARAADAAGDYSRAVLYLFSHQLLQLGRRQIIDLQRGKTNRQYLRETRSRGPLGRVLEPVMVAFEDVFFGHHAIDGPRMQACWAEHARFEQLLREAVP